MRLPYNLDGWVPGLVESFAERALLLTQDKLGHQMYTRIADSVIGYTNSMEKSKCRNNRINTE